MIASQELLKWLKIHASHNVEVNGVSLNNEIERLINHLNQLRQKYFEMERII